MRLKSAPFGELIETLAFDRNGNVAWILHETSPVTAYYTDGRGFPLARTESGAAHLEFLLGEDGYEREIHYLDRNGNRHPDDNGIFGVRYECDGRGLAVRAEFLDYRYRRR